MSVCVVCNERRGKLLICSHTETNESMRIQVIVIHTAVRLENEENSTGKQVFNRAADEGNEKAGERGGSRGWRVKVRHEIGNLEADCWIYFPFLLLCHQVTVDAVIRASSCSPLTGCHSHTQADGQAEVDLRMPATASPLTYFDLLPLSLFHIYSISQNSLM